MEQVWYYNGSVYEPMEDVTSKSFPYHGFVYIIHNTENGKSYIGKKSFTMSKTRQVNKKKKRYRVESDWRTYYGSSEELKQDVEYYGSDKFVRTILHLCRSKGECSYYEAYEQFSRNVLLSDEYYNSWISVRVRSSHLRQMIQEHNTDPTGTDTE